MIPSFLFRALAFAAVVSASSSKTAQACSVFSTDSLPKCSHTPSNFVNSSTPSAPDTPDSSNAKSEVLEDAFAALAVLQNEYFDWGKNTWPSAIDWTAAVTETVVSAMLKTLMNSLDSVFPENLHKPKEKMNLMASFYDQVISYYFGQNYVSIMGQAFDDMLWVVLGWIEASTFAESYGKRYFPSQGNDNKFPTDINAALTSIPWHGHLWLPSFYSRAQDFWKLASRGWDDTLCHGGMNWNPNLETYKNAVTNELWIAASVSMYQYYRDDDGSFGSPSHNLSFSHGDPAYLEAAIRGYKWIMQVNLTNNQGLFVDGYHINRNIPGNVECDVRDEMVYTYNQGILLTGQRGLWTVTGSPSYLEDGHQLIQSVIRATGWDPESNAPMEDLEKDKGRKLPLWRGIGRGGILEEQCDASGTCSQDGQTFKGIFFHHMTAFCEPLDPQAFRKSLETNNGIDWEEFERIKLNHAKACRAYLGWVKHNAKAALKTRDSRGRFGMWWGATLFGSADISESQDGINHVAGDVTDYRNRGTPADELWGLNSTWQPGIKRVDGRVERPVASVLQAKIRRRGNGSKDPKDPNDRGRGRTVETQIGGLALLRAYWELANLLQ